MTRVQVRLGIERPLDESMLARIADAHSIYGIERITISPSGNELIVDYDATRLRPKEVKAALARIGVPVVETAGKLPETTVEK